MIVGRGRRIAQRVALLLVVWLLVGLRTTTMTMMRFEFFVGAPLLRFIVLVEFVFGGVEFGEG